MVTFPKGDHLIPMSIPEQMTVRLAKPEDAASIESFSAAMALETEGRHLDRERLHDGTMALLQSPARGFFMVAEWEQNGNRRLVGQLMITYEWSEWRNGAFWWIQSVYVDPAWRRRGVYRQLHDTVVAIGKSDTKMCGVRLYVARDNRAAQTVYKRVGLAPSMYDVYEDDFVLRRHGQE